MSNNTYRNHIVSGQDYKPLLHKKGKQWIVVGLSTLMLATFGFGLNVPAHAATNTVKANINHQLASAKVNAQSASAQPVQASSAKASQGSNVSAQSSQASSDNVTPQAKTMYHTLVSGALNKFQGLDQSASAQEASIRHPLTKVTNNGTDNTLHIDNTAEGRAKQARAWNFIQHGMDNHDYDNYKAPKALNSGSAQASSSISAGSVKAASVKASAQSSASSESATEKNVAKANQVDDRKPSFKVGAVAPSSKKQDTDYVAFADASDNNGIEGVTTITGNDGSTYSSDELKKKLPSGYQLTFNEPTLTFDSNHDQGNPYIVNVSAINANDNEHTSDIPVYSPNVTFKGIIDLHFHDGNNTLKDIFLPYNISTKNNMVLQDILNDTNPSARIPADYLNKVITWATKQNNQNKFNTHNFTYDNNVNSTVYDGVAIDPNATGYVNNGNGYATLNNGQITLDFSSKKMDEHVHYNYNNGKDNAGSTTLNGDNDTSTDITSDVANQNGLHKGWHLVTPNNNFTFGNGGSDASGKYSDNETVPVVPNTANATIQFQVSDGNSNSTNNGSNLNTITQSGDDYRTNSVTHDGTYTTKSTDVPEGYHIVSGNGYTVNHDGTVTVNYDNNTHTIKIVGNNHNQSNKGTTTPSNTNPSTLPNTDPNYVPASDVVTVNSKEYNNSQPIRTITRYIAVSGKTGESYTLNPNNFRPDGYKVTPNEQNQGGVFNANGISNKTITFKYDAKQGTDISVDYINQNGANVGNYLITGNVDDTGNILKVNGAGMPKGYQFVSVKDNGNKVSGASAQNIPYRITTTGQNIVVTVAGNSINGNSSTVHNNHPTVPSDKPASPTNPSDVPSEPLNPNKPSDSNHPSDNPEVPSHKQGNKQVPNTTDTTPNRKNTTGNKPYSNPSNLTPANKNDANDTFYVVINDFGYNRKDGQYDKLERQYVKRVTPTGKIGNKFTINPAEYVTNGYNENTTGNQQYIGYFGVDKNGNEQLLANDDQTPQNSIVWNYDANVQTATIHFQNQDGTDVTPQSGTINGHTDSDIDPTKPSDGGIAIPSGYHLSPDTTANYHFNAPTNNPNNNPEATYKVQGNEIKGNVHVNLVYQETNGSGTTKTDSTSSTNVGFDNKVGDKSLVITPWSYWKPNYDVSDASYTVPFTSDVAPNGNNLSYDKSTTFTYTGQTAGDLDVQYVDVDQGAKPINNEKTDAKGQPIVGSQDLGSLGVAGQLVQLGQVNNVHNNNHDIDNNGVMHLLRVPKNWILVKKINNITIQLHNKPTTLTLLAVMPDFNHHKTPAKPAKKAESTIVVNYVDKANGKVINSNLPMTREAGTKFNINAYLDNIPSGYTYDNVRGSVDKFDDANHIISILLNKDVAPSSASANSAKSAKSGSATSAKSSSASSSASHSTTTKSGNTTIINNSYFYHYSDTNNSENNSENAELTSLNSEVVNDDKELASLNAKEASSASNESINEESAFSNLLNSGVNAINNLATSVTNSLTNNMNANASATSQTPAKPNTNNNASKAPKAVAVDDLHVGQSANLDGAKVTRLNMSKHFRWFMVTSNTLAHTDLASVGTPKNAKLEFRPNHKLFFRIAKIFKVTKKNGSSVIRYEFKVGKHNYFVTGNSRFTKNSYLQIADFKKSELFHIRLLKPAYEYKSKHFDKKSFIRSHKAGSRLTVKAILMIGRKGDYQTRLELANGHFITANKNWVKLVK